MKLLDNNVQHFKSSAVSSFSSVVKKAAVTTTAFLGIHAAIETVKGSIDFVKDYSATMSDFQAATGASAQELANMEKSASDLYKKGLGESFKDLVSSMTTTKQVTGQVGDELKKTTALAVTYRDVFGEEVADSVKVADTMMKNFGISSTQAYNLLAQGAQKGLNKSGELLDTANEYSVYFKNLGFGANQMFDIFGAGLEKGAFNLDKVGDAVKEFEIRSKDMSKSSLQAFKALGFNGTKMSETFAKGGPAAQKAFKQIVQSISSIKDPVKKNTIGVALFGTQFEDMEKDVIAALGTADKKFEMTKTTMDGINKIKYNSASEAFTGIGRQLEMSVMVPITKKLLPKLSEFGQWFSSHSGEIEAGINQAFALGSSLIADFADGLSWAKDNANWLIPVIGGLTAAFVAQQSVNKLVKMLDAYKKVTKELTLVQVIFKTVMSANPFGLIAIGIGLAVAAGVLLYKNWDKVIAWAQKLGANISDIWGTIQTTITGAVSKVAAWLESFPLGQSIVQSFRDAVANVKMIFGGIITFFKSVFKGDWKGAWDGIVEVFKGTFGLMKTYAKAPINGIISMVNTLIDQVNGIKVTIPDWVPKFGGKSFGINIPKISTFALGTSYFQGGLAQVNERGGEIINLPNGSQVIPADKSEKMIESSRGGVKVQITIQGNVIGNAQFLDELGSLFHQEIKLALANM
ncbi:phage tail tape measure protein [Paenibacillus artemisiicola]|nr:phage tail tape measure protein [Paenibacillus artemisiicola]